MILDTVFFILLKGGENMKFRHMLMRYRLPLMTAGVSSVFAFSAFAEDTPGATVVTASDWSAVISALTAQVSVSTIIAALATFVTAGIGIVFMWWGLRKGIRSLMAAFRKGRMSV